MKSPINENSPEDVGVIDCAKRRGLEICKPKCSFMQLHTYSLKEMILNMKVLNQDADARRRSTGVNSHTLINWESMCQVSSSTQEIGLLTSRETS